jgi:hypothetical protein
MNPLLQTPCQVTEPCAAISFIRFTADSDAHSLQPRESANVTSPAFASADLPFDALPAFCLAASAAGARNTRAAAITTHNLPDILMLIIVPALFADRRTLPTFRSLRFGEKRGNSRPRMRRRIHRAASAVLCTRK